MQALYEDPPLDALYPPSLNLVAFYSSGARLNGRVFTAQGAHAHPTILLLHGYPGVEQNQDLAHAFRRAGWNVVMYHYRGAWGSEGEFSVSHLLEDTQAVAEAIRQPEFVAQYRVDAERIVLMGHSMGGFAALMAAAELPWVHAAASLAGFYVTGHARLLNEDDFDQEAYLWGLETAPLRGATGAGVVQELLTHAEDWDLLRRAPAFSGRAVCMVGATMDSIAPTALHLEPLAAAYRDHGARVTSHTLEADHSFSSARIALAARLLAWLASL
jgi:pimeloyl-ACP methyl ester carboxylesterase